MKQTLILPLLAMLLLAAPGLAATELAERELEAKIERQLEAVVGPGKARVSVSGRQDEPGIERSLRNSRPQLGTQRSSRERHSDGVHVSERSTTQSSWVYDQSEELRSRRPAGLKQKSVSVIFEPPQSPEGEEGAERPAVDQALIEDIVRSTGGIDESRGDHLSVHAVTLDTSATDRLRDEMEKQRQGTPWWVFGLIGLGGSGLGAGLVVLLLRRRRQPEVAAEWPPAPYAPPVYAPATYVPPGNPALNPAHPLGTGPHGPVIQIRPE
ncbi:MAG TPA: flagellar M-ring protein FliF C-terminal domain-containing protein [Candidatus Obscuribacterales bacterium]